MTNKIMARLRGGVSSYRILFEGDNLPDLGLKAPSGLDKALPYTPNEGPEAEFNLYYVELDQEQKNKMIDPYLEASNLGAQLASQPEYDAINTVYKIY